jgi:hypothetical protein
MESIPSLHNRCTGYCLIWHAEAPVSAYRTLPSRCFIARAALYFAVMAASCRATLLAGSALKHFAILPPPDVACSRLITWPFLSGNSSNVHDGPEVVVSHFSPVGSVLSSGSFAT